MRGFEDILVLTRPKSFNLANTNLTGCFDNLYQTKLIEAVFLLSTDDCSLLVDSHEQDDSQGTSPTQATRRSMVRILNAEFSCLFPFQISSVRSKCLMWFSLELSVN